MGKHQRKTRIRSARLAASAANGVPASDKATATPADRKKEILPIVAKLAAPEVSDRIWAAASISGLIATGDPSLRLLLLAQNLVGRLIELLSTENTNLKLEVTGVLRNLAVEGGADVCAEMYNKQITPPLAAHLDLLTLALARATQPSEAMPEARPDEPKEMRAAWDWAENVITIFWSIAELAPKSLNTLVDLPSLVPFLLAILKAAEASTRLSASEVKTMPPLSLGIAAAHCLAVLCDSNHAVSLRMLAHPAHLDLEPLIALLRPELQARASTELHLLGVLCASALLNIYSSVLVDRQLRTAEEGAAFAPKAIRGRALELKEDVDRLAPRVLAHVLEGFDVQVVVDDAARVFAASAGKPASLGHENAVTALNDRLTAVQVSLEVLGEISASIDGLVVDPDQEEEEWNGIAEDDMDEDVSPGEVAQANGHHSPALSLSSDTLSLLSALPSRLVTLAKPTSAGFAPGSAVQDGNILPTESNETTSSPERPTVPTSTAALVPLLHLRALECLNNLFITLARSANGATTAVNGADEDSEEDGDMPDGMAALAQASGAKLPEAFASTAQAVWEGLFAILVELQQTTLPPAPAPLSKKSKPLPPLGTDELVHATEAALGAIWALSRAHIDGLVVGQSETPFLLSLLRSNISDEAKTRAVGALAVLAARQGVSLEENKAVGDALLSLATTVAAPMLLSTQALDGVFDIYADETREHDVVFRNGGYLAVLEALPHQWRTRTRQVDKRKEGELRAMANEAGTNLRAFISYRKGLP